VTAEPQNAREPLLAVRNLTISYHSHQFQPSKYESSDPPAVAGVSFSLGPGDSLGIFGKSGSGKTTLARSLLGLNTRRDYRVTSGSIRFRGIEILGLPSSRLQELRGRDLALISQEPELALNPVLTVGDQIVEVLRSHVPGNIRAHREQASWMLAKVRLEDRGIYRSYPHQLSGGQRQRAVIAQALVCKPALLIADEPTSALDLRNQAEIIHLLQALREEFNLCLILISHNVQLLRGATGRLACMSEGRMTEDATPDARRPASFPPALGSETQGQRPEALVQARGLFKYYRRGAYWSSSRYRVTALAGVDFAIRRGQTVALVGESGSGKTTLARCLALLEDPDAGSIRFEGKDVRRLSKVKVAVIRRQIQLVFQHSALAMNPHLSAEEIVSEPLRIQGGISHQQRRRTARSWMEQVGLSPGWAGRRPAQFSGGQRQRLAIARAMILNPALVIFDEAFAGLDPATCAEILNLLLELQSSSATSYMFITHDLQIAKDLTKAIFVMQDGKIADSELLSDMLLTSTPMRRASCSSHT